MNNKSIPEAAFFLLASTLLLYYCARPAFSSKNTGKASLDKAKSEKGAMPEMPSGFTVADQHSLALLTEKMQGGLYKEPALSVARIAEEIRVPEHRLRALINTYLGYRNISQFLNEYRIAEAKSRLSDVSQRHVPILTIAMEAGYVSLRPFNRAFKEQTAQTPSEFRAHHLSDAVGEPE